MLFNFKLSQTQLKILIETNLSNEKDLKNWQNKAQQPVYNHKKQAEFNRKVISVGVLNKPHHMAQTKTMACF